MNWAQHKHWWMKTRQPFSDVYYVFGSNTDHPEIGQLNTMNESSFLVIWAPELIQYG